MSLKIGLNNVTNEQYHSDTNFLSSSDLKLILKDPEQFYKEKILGEKERVESAAFEDGTFIHSLILEPNAVKDEYAFYPGLVKRGAEFEKFKADNVGKKIISLPQKTRCELLFNSYNKLEAAKSLINGGESEFSIVQEILDVGIKVRCDYINQGGYIVDVKTSGYPVDLESFKLTVDQYRYDLSAALYCMAAEKYFNRKFDFYFIALSKKDLNCEVFKLSEMSRRKGDALILEALDLYKECKKTGLWKKKDNPLIKPTLTDYEVLEI
jgi:hypothetical protein